MPMKQTLMPVDRQSPDGWAGKTLQYAADCLAHLPWPQAWPAPWQSRWKRMYFPVTDGQLLSDVGTRAGDAIVLSGSPAGMGLYGPYIDLPQGHYRASIHFTTDREARGTVRMDVCTDVGLRIIRTASFNLAKRRRIGFAFSLDRAATKCEVRLHCPEGTSASIKGIEIAGLDSTRSAKRRPPKDLQRVELALTEINARLDRLERLSHGGRATYVGDNRVLAKVAIGDLVLGFLVHANDRLIAPYIIARGEYEPSLTRFFLENVTATAHCLDVGANFGYYTCLFADLARQGRTVGIEPDEPVFELLRDNINSNCLEAFATARHAAVSDIAGQLTLFRRVTRSGNTSIIKLTGELVHFLGETAPEPFQVECVAIDDLLPHFDGRIDVMKIDVEGAEPLAFRGAHKTIASNPHIKIVMEWAPHQIRAAGFDPGDFLAELDALRLQAVALDIPGPRPTALRDLIRLDYHAGILLTVRP